jgi:hypothetical protein
MKFSIYCIILLSNILVLIITKDCKALKSLQCTPGTILKAMRVSPGSKLFPCIGYGETKLLSFSEDKPDGFLKFYLNIPDNESDNGSLGGKSENGDFLEGKSDDGSHVEIPLEEEENNAPLLYGEEIQSGAVTITDSGLVLIQLDQISIERIHTPRSIIIKLNDANVLQCNSDIQQDNIYDGKKKNGKNVCKQHEPVDSYFDLFAIHLFKIEMNRIKLGALSKEVKKQKYSNKWGYWEELRQLIYNTLWFLDNGIPQKREITEIKNKMWDIKYHPQRVFITAETPRIEVMGHGFFNVDNHSEALTSFKHKFDQCENAFDEYYKKKKPGSKEFKIFHLEE